MSSYKMSSSKTLPTMYFETAKRLLKDVKQMIKHPLTENGIYYSHDDENMSKGYAMIVGPEGTPYFGGFYFFVLTFPPNYPFSPPHVTYMTNNGYTRFNPNLYTCGKVCVSILNTWHGEKWSSCQSISTVLLALCSLLNDSPLENEPEQTKSSIDYIPYQQSIEYMNIDFAMCDMICQQSIPEPFRMFYPFMKEHFLRNYDKVMENIKMKNGVIKKNFVGTYRMITEVNYVRLEQKIIQAKSYVESLEDEQEQER